MKITQKEIKSMFLKSFIKKFILILILFLPNIVHANFNVKMSCTGYGQNYDWWQCLNSKYTKSDFELTQNGQKKIYKFYELMQNRDLSRGRFVVPNSFKIYVQNVNDNFVLGIVITNNSGEQVYQDEVGKYGVINVGN